MPKLPKGGQIEINLVCDSESTSSQAPATVHVADDASEPVLQGIVAYTESSPIIVPLWVRPNHNGPRLA